VNRLFSESWGDFEVSMKKQFYHFTKRENVEGILREGLLSKSKFLALGSKIREEAIHLWFAPSNDVMGYFRNEDYVCLEADVDSSDCIIAPMDVISAAFYNFFAEKQGNVVLYDYRKLAELHDRMSVPIETYKLGMFRTPEVLVKKRINPENIRVVNPARIRNEFIDNLKIYEDSIKKFSPQESQKVAMHDDSSGILASYLTKDGEFFTINA